MAKKKEQKPAKQVIYIASQGTDTITTKDIGAALKYLEDENYENDSLVDVCDEMLELICEPALADGLYKIEFTLTKMKKSTCSRCGSAVYK